ncbi:MULTISPECIES: TetR/AcrR family transcriptional regulator [unclassified Virgibacillus]|uniref:TetR/AcrR family transcriptional regulator n=1 Tax=unclassified Virgibacillus TaxID=2620237 RepID=UPI0024DE742F|nr:TetR/AcrR family transcriptional regulator [Virgibacillus sp. LDC-1]
MNHKKQRTPGRPPANHQKLPTDQLILQKAAQLFLENGYKDVSMDDVAKSCQVTKATVYYYYQTKADLYSETMTQMMERVHQIMIQILSEDAPLYTRLYQVASAYLNATVHIDMDDMIKGTKNSLSETQIKAMQEAEAKIYRVVANALATAMHTKEIRQIDPLFAAHAFISLLKIGNYRDTDNNGLFASVDDSVLNIINFFWKSIANE